mmetsp:Transcript_19209/g.41744  ORF Transcript_19209/g.41744 Transcript_19209/m.41744 type:complete len:187 (+) Transcript_19209:113-673(+)|eukprot:CAMPEP_0168181328 /NCGR_PEP_ID=MMETSP0139_2-20121125/11148_1 /TAXON_ID=44445 /ORGANISM="Pseudo-nitzschia australis, Strain 10249 10 AB" /LENGTH=186 /DNA_ID=CAMNT_0008101877 /DNA_START=46 /DNA_END=606 /DNA_ORIENTATION=-
MAKKKSQSKQEDKPKKAKREVKVVKCPSAFPISTKPKKRPRDDPRGRDEARGASKNNKLLDLHQTVKEVRAYGATAFIGKQKRDYEDEKYYNLTGRHKKKNSCPLPLVRGLKRAAAKRDAKAREEARQAGIVIPKQKEESSRKSMSDADFRKFGPAPNIGFMKGGAYRVPNGGDFKGMRNGNGRKR